MPNPASSGTGFFDVTAWLTLFGDGGKGGGWQFMNGLYENIAQYALRLQACNMAASGEFVLGISFEYRGNSNKARAHRLIWCSRRKAWLGSGAFGIHKGARSLMRRRSSPTGRRSKDAMALYGKNFAITAVPGMAPPLPDALRL